MSDLTGKKIAILVANGFEESELIEPKKALEKVGAKLDIISPEKNKVKAWKHTDWSQEYAVNVPLEKANAEDYHALLLPGGVINPDTLRLNEKAIAFIRKFVIAEKPIAAICHGPWTLINAGMTKGYKLTSWPSIRMDLMNAGYEWVDEEAVVDRNLITSRKPGDIPAFNKALIILLTEKETIY